MTPMESWKQKALGIYIPEGIMAKGAETVRVYVKKTAETFMESQKEYYKKTHNFKAIYGKKFGSNNIIRKGEEKIKNYAMQKAYDIGSEELKKYLDGKYDSATGTTVANEISSQELDYRLSMKLYNCTGYEFDQSGFLNKFTREIGNENEKYHYYEEWRKNIIPDVLKNAYEEERDRLFFSLNSRFAEGNPRPNRETVEKVLNEGAKALGDIFEDFGMKLANKTKVLDIPPRFIEDRAADIQEMPEGLTREQADQWQKNVVRPGLTEKNVLEKQIKEISYAYPSIDEIKKKSPDTNPKVLSAKDYFNFYEKNPDSMANTVWDYGKWVYDGVSGAISSSVSTVKNVAQTTKSISSYVANEAYNYSAAFIKKMTGMEEDTIASLSRWQQKALDIYIPNGIIADQTEKARVYVKNLVKEKIKENREWYENDKSTFKEIYGKAYGKNGKASRLNQKIVNKSMTTVLDTTEAYVSDLLDGKYKSSNGKDVAEGINPVFESLDYPKAYGTIIDKLKNKSGYEFDKDAFIKRFREELSHEDEQYHYNDDWRKKIMPEVIKAAYRDELGRMYDGIRENFEKESMTSSSELYRSAVESGTRIMGEFFEKFGEDLANNTEYLDLPPRLVKNPDEDLKSMPDGLTKELQDKWAKQVTRPGLFENQKELDLNINKAISGYKLPSAEKAFDDFKTLMNSNRADNIKEACGIGILKDLKKKNAGRGFFNRIFNFRKNRNEKKRIKEMENSLKEKFGLTDEALNNFKPDDSLSVKDIKNSVIREENTASENISAKIEAEESFDKETGKEAIKHRYMDDTEISYSGYKTEAEKSEKNFKESGLDKIYDQIEGNPEIQNNVDDSSKEGMFSYFKSYVVYTPDSKRNEGKKEIDGMSDEIGQNLKFGIEQEQDEGKPDIEIIANSKRDIAKLIYLNDIRTAMNIEANNNRVFEYQDYLEPKTMDDGINHIMSSPAFKRVVSNLNVNDINSLNEKKNRDKIHKDMVAQRDKDKESHKQKKSEDVNKKLLENAKQNIKEEVNIKKGSREV